MGDVWYRGLTFVYDVSGEYELAKRKVKLIEKIVRNYEDAVSGFCIPKIGCVILKGDEMIGCHIVGDWRTSEIPGDIEDKSICREIWREEIGESLLNVGHNVHWEILARNIEDIEFKAFPPRRYMQKWGVKYDKKFPFPEGQKEGNLVVIWSGEDPRNRKFYISLDFGTFEDYIYTEDEKLARAVEEFLVDLMRDIVKATEPEYAYFDYDEYEPLEEDPICEGNKELKRIPSGYDGKMHVVLGNIAYIRKDLIERAVKGDIKRAYHPFYKEFYDVYVEDLGTHYLMYPDRFLNPGGVLVYETGDEDEYEKFAYFEEKEVLVKYVCGDLSRGIVLGVKPNKQGMRREGVERIVDEWVKNQNVRIRKLDYLSKD